jgi:hypothetical protein
MTVTFPNFGGVLLLIDTAFTPFGFDYFDMLQILQEFSAVMPGGLGSQYTESLQLEQMFLVLVGSIEEVYMMASPPQMEESSTPQLNIPASQSFLSSLLFLTLSLSQSLRFTYLFRIFPNFDESLYTLSRCLSASQPSLSFLSPQPRWQPPHHST